MNLTDKDINRFWSSVDIKGIDDCWPCRLAASNRGYSNFQLTHFDRKKVLAHRVSWFLTYGSIPEDKLILHKCDNRRCCNPNHLYAGDYSNNLSDAHDRGRRVIIPLRHARGKAKLYAGEIWLIRKLKVLGLCGRHKFSQSLISKMFGVDQVTISKIWNSNSWICKEGYYA